MLMCTRVRSTPITFISVHFSQNNFYRTHLYKIKIERSDLEKKDYGEDRKDLYGEKMF